MPEGPEVETIRRDIESLICGRQIVDIRLSGKALRTPISLKSLKPLIGQTIQAANRHGKLLWLEINETTGVFFRLGMTGRIHIHEQNHPGEAHTHVTLRFDNNEELRFIDPRRFGSVVPYFSIEEKKAEFAKMGPDPLAWGSKPPAEVAQKMCESARLLKVLLMDQKLIAGVGNIYASEALFLAELSPFKRGDQITIKQATRLLQCCRKAMQTAVDQRGTTFMSYVDGFGRKGDNQSRLFVFSRAGKPCKKCQTPIKKSIQAGRSTFYCQSCQK
ncbi:MAG: bifunctional DNA-formamidopyrimidine glycosylase/DNA-(apurinic or apyrimidinic site) lyase [Myxococcota bacterium]